MWGCLGLRTIFISNTCSNDMHTQKKRGGSFNDDVKNSYQIPALRIEKGTRIVQL